MTMGYYRFTSFPNICLTSIETDCLLQLVRGSNLKDLMFQLNIAPRTLQFYMDSLLKKFNVVDLNALVALIKNSDFIKECKEKYREAPCEQSE